MFVPPTPAQFQSFFARDFWYAQPTDQSNLDLVLQADIAQAIIEAQIHFNPGLYGSDVNSGTVFMYLAAYHLVRKMQVSEKGLSSQSRFPISSNSVGGVSIGFALPERYNKDPWLSSLTENGYGKRFLEFTLPLLEGNIFVVRGGPRV